MNLKPTKLRNSNQFYPSSSNYFLSFVGEVLRFVLSRVFFFQLFLPGTKRIACAEKRLIPLDRRGGHAPKTGNSQIDFDLWFRLPAGFHFWLANCHLTTLNLSSLVCWFSSGLKILNTVFWLGLDTIMPKLRR